MSFDRVHRYMTCSWSTYIGGHSFGSSSADDMYHEVDIPSLVDISTKSLVDHLRAISTCLSTNLLSAYQAI